MNEKDKHLWGHTILRVTIGFLFLITGYGKVTNPDGVVGMLTGFGLPIPIILAWILILSELIFGALVLVGYKVKYTAWPLAAVLLLAWILVSIPKFGVLTPFAMFHLIGAAGAITIALTGPGKWALSKVH